MVISEIFTLDDTPKDLQKNDPSKRTVYREVKQPIDLPGRPYFIAI